MSLGYTNVHLLAYLLTRPNLRDPDYLQNLMVSSKAHVHISTEFCENRSSSFCVILLTNKVTN